MFMNFMNFTDDACMAMFSLGQKQRAWHTLNTIRSGLLNSPGCLPPLHTTNPQPHNRIRLLTNPASGSIQLKTSNLKDSILHWRLYTTNGQIAANGQMPGADFISIPMPLLPPGVYFFSLTGMETLFSTKIVITP